MSVCTLPPLFLDDIAQWKAIKSAASVHFSGGRHTQWCWGDTPSSSQENKEHQGRSTAHLIWNTPPPAPEPVLDKLGTKHCLIRGAQARLEPVSASASWPVPGDFSPLASLTGHRAETGAKGLCGTETVHIPESGGFRRILATLLVLPRLSQRPVPAWIPREGWSLQGMPPSSVSVPPQCHRSPLLGLWVYTPIPLHCSYHACSAPWAFS